MHQTPIRPHTTLARRLLTACILSFAACGSPDMASSMGGPMQELLEQFPNATQVDERSISWNNGTVMLVLPDVNASAEEAMAGSGSDSTTAATVKGCPSGWYCVYADANWGGRQLQFSLCQRNDLDDYGFRDKTSSWVNNGPHRVQVKNDLSLRPDEVLWTMASKSKASYVGDSDNNKADYFQCE